VHAQRLHEREKEFLKQQEQKKKGQMVAEDEVTLMKILKKSALLVMLHGEFGGKLVLENIYTQRDRSWQRRR